MKPAQHQIVYRACDYCNGEGRIETDNNGPTVKCPICNGKKIRMVRKPITHGMGSVGSPAEI